MTFVRDENKPSVMMLSGRLTILMIGFMITSIIVRINPAMRIVGSPPCMVTPATMNGRRKSANA